MTSSRAIPRALIIIAVAAATCLARASDRVEAQPAPEPLVLVDQFGGDGAALTASGDHIYLSRGQRLAVLRLQGAVPTLVSLSSLVDARITHLASAGNRLYAADASGALTTFALEPPENPTALATLSLGEPVTGLAASADWVVVTQRYRLRAFKQIAGQLTELASLSNKGEYASLTAPNDLFVVAFVSGSQGGVATYRIENDSLSEIGSATVRCPPRHLAADPRHGIVACGTEAFIVELSTNYAPRVLGTVDRSLFTQRLQSIHSVAIDAEAAYIGSFSGDVPGSSSFGGTTLVARLNLDDPSRPVVATEIDAEISAMALLNVGDKVLASDPFKGIFALDALDLSVEGALELPGLALDLAIHGGRAFVASGRRVSGVDLAQPDVTLSAVDLQSRSAMRVFADRDTLWISTLAGHDAVTVAHPLPLAADVDATPVASFRGATRAVASDDDIGFLATSDGLVIVRYGDPGAGPRQVAEISGGVTRGVESLQLPSGSGAVVGRGTLGICTVTTHFPALPEYGPCVLPRGFSSDIDRIDDRHLVVNESGELRVVAQERTTLTSVSAAILYDPKAIVANGRRIYALTAELDGVAGEWVHAFDFDGVALRPLGSVALPKGDEAHWIAVSGNLVFVAMNRSGVVVLEDVIPRPGAPTSTPSPTPAESATAATATSQTPTTPGTPTTISSVTPSTPIGSASPASPSPSSEADTPTPNGSEWMIYLPRLASP